MPTMSENKKAGKADTFLSWTLGVLACLWVAWCCGIGPLYWFGTGLADFGWANVLYMAIAFVVSFAILSLFYEQKTEDLSSSWLLHLLES